MYAPQHFRCQASERCQFADDSRWRSTRLVAAKWIGRLRLRLLRHFTAIPAGEAGAASAKHRKAAAFITAAGAAAAAVSVDDSHTALGSLWMMWYM